MHVHTLYACAGDLGCMQQCSALHMRTILPDLACWCVFVMDCLCMWKWRGITCNHVGVWMNKQQPLLLGEIWTAPLSVFSFWSMLPLRGGRWRCRYYSSGATHWNAHAKSGVQIIMVERFWRRGARQVWIIQNNTFIAMVKTQFLC